jgi:Tol biopolymer transport system component
MFRLTHRIRGRAGRRALIVLALAVAVALPLAALLAGCGEGVSPITSPGEPGLSPAVRLVVLASDRAGQPGNFDLYLYDLDNIGFLPLTGLNSSTSNELNPTLSPDLRYVAFSANRGGGTGPDIHLYDRVQRVLLPMTAVNTIAGEFDPAFSADGKHMAYVHSLAGRLRIRVTQDFPATALTALPGLDTAATAAYDDSQPAPDSTARRIAFVSTRNGNLDVFVWDRDSSGVLSLPDLASPANDVDPALTPDGRWLVFASDRAPSGSYRLFLYDLETRLFVAMPGLSAPGVQRHPSIHRDATRMAFESDRADGLGRIDVWLYNRTSGVTSQPLAMSSSGDDVLPWLNWK